MSCAIDELEAFAKSVDGDVPLGSYGEGNVRIMKQAAKKFDSEEVFQKRVPGGFKISSVGS
ncbi:hypothetical protein BDV18DRAFT_165050 [Aspergillus unguis]